MALHESDAQRDGNLPHAAIEPLPAGGQPAASTAATPAPAQPSPPGREDFRCGEEVSLDDRCMRTETGTIVGITQCTATVETAACSPSQVPCRLLRHIVDV